MQSEFANAGKRLETTIPVPELSIASIRERSRTANVRHRPAIFVAYALAALTILASTAVLAAMVGGVRLWISGNRASLYLNAFQVVTPTAAHLRRAAADATFPVVFPVPIPRTMHLVQLFLSPATRPSFIGLTYMNGRSGSAWTFMLVDTASINQGIPPMPAGKWPAFQPVTRWTVGRETVVVPGAWAHQSIKAGMLRSTPAESLKQTLSALYRISVLGGFPSVADSAEAIAPRKGHSVLVDRGNLGQLAALAAKHKALYVVVTSSVNNVPTVNGRPDFAHQSSSTRKMLALSADGVRAIAAVLATGACGKAGTMGSGFNCEMLINERGGRDYRVWSMPLDASRQPTKYVVNSKTFRVKPMG